MCMVCRDFELGKLTLPEAYRNLREVWDEKNNPHCMDVWIKLVNAELNVWDNKEGKQND